VAYVSLFGKETISSIRTDIFLQVLSKKKKAWHATAKHIKDITIPYIGIGITLLDKQDFKDIIVCFDDFERLSSSMELKEVLGLISELKEQKNCSVVMILNEDELRDNKETLDKYKEKLIIFSKFKKRRGLCVNGGNFDNTAHYLSCNFWHIFNIRLNKREII
jgi:predicted DNA-binding protein YlxM (UPF0122 family)